MVLIGILGPLLLGAAPPDPRSIPAEMRISYVNKLIDRFDGPNAARSYGIAREKYVGLYELSEDAALDPDSPYMEVDYNLSDLTIATEWTPAQRGVIDEWLKANRRTLGALRGATKKRGFFEPLKHGTNRLSKAALDATDASFVSLARLMATRANQAAMDGEWEDAYEWLVRMHDMADHLHHRPFSMDRMIARGVEREAVRATVAMIARHAPHDWEELIAAIKNHDDTRCPDSLIAEAEALWTFDYLECWHEWVDQPEKHTDLTEMAEMFVPSAGDDDFVEAALNDILGETAKGAYASIDALRTAIRASSIEQDWANAEKLDAVYAAWAALPSPVAWKRVEGYEAEYCEAKKRVPSFALVACSPMWSSQPRYGYDITLMHREAMFCQIALSRYRAKQNRWPNKLDDLVPEFLEKVPIDTFSGKRLVYRADRPKGTYTLYSVGPNLVDDSGKVGGGFPRPDGDLVFWPIPTRPAPDE